MDEFRTDSLSEDKKYLLYLPYEGATNQFYCLIRAMHVARALNRTLLIPPLMPSKHNSIRGNFLDWRYILDLDSLAEISELNCRFKFISKEMIPQMKIFLEDEESKCFTYGYWSYFYTLGISVAEFARAFDLIDHLQLEYHNLPTQGERNSTYLVNVFRKRSNASMVCVANLQHLCFGNKMNPYLKHQRFSERVANAAWNFMHYNGLSGKRYGAVHWRRGDFEYACRNKTKWQCWPGLDQLEKALLRVSSEHGLDTFIVATNDPTFDLSMAEHGIDICVIRMAPPDAGDPEGWYHLAPVFIDTFLLTYSDYFIGNRFSTISRSVISRRNQMGLHDKTETF